MHRKSSWHLVWSLVSLLAAPASAFAQSARPEVPSAGGVQVLNTFEVMSSKLLNMDIKRTRDDVQPYVVFDNQVIADAGAIDVEEFLKQRLTLNAHAVAADTTGQISSGATSSIDLRGLGVGQTWFWSTAAGWPAPPSSGPSASLT